MTPVAVVLAVTLALSSPVTALQGRASWYAAPTGTAAAGPSLRASLGRGWRGTVVRVSANGRTVRVRLTDWCQCFRGTRRERVIDLARADFARLAPLSVGVVRVSVR